MLIRQPIRNTDSIREAKPRVFDAIIDENEVYLEVKNARQIELIRLTEVLRQIEDARRKVGQPTS